MATGEIADRIDNFLVGAVKRDWGVDFALGVKCSQYCVDWKICAVGEEVYVQSFEQRAFRLLDNFKSALLFRNLGYLEFYFEISIIGDQEFEPRNKELQLRELIERERLKVQGLAGDLV